MAEERTRHGKGGDGGGGKTVLALLIAQLLQNTEDKELRLVIVVPTIVLMLQWYDAILESGNLPAEAIGRLGGGYDEDFQGRRILIAVLASASQRLAKLVKESEIEDHLLFVVDECHHSAPMKCPMYYGRGADGHSGCPRRRNAMKLAMGTTSRWSGGSSAPLSTSSTSRTLTVWVDTEIHDSPFRVEHDIGPAETI